MSRLALTAEQHVDAPPRLIADLDDAGGPRAAQQPRRLPPR
jgi:hypothetical protein